MKALYVTAFFSILLISSSCTADNKAFSSHEETASRKSDIGYACRVHSVHSLSMLDDVKATGPEDWDLKSLLQQTAGEESKDTFNKLCSAAKNGDGYAQYQLAIVYNKGFSVKKSVLDSYYWFVESARRGNSTAEKAVESLSKNISWSFKDEGSSASLTLHSNGITYPNANNIQGTIDNSRYLSIKTGEQVSAVFESSKCVYDSNSECQESVDIAILDPEGNIVQYQPDLKLKASIETDSGKGTRKIFNIKANESDKRGQYLIFIQTRNSTGPISELSQTFWIK